MNIRVYYKTDGTILSVVIIGTNDWNLLEVGSVLSAKSATFPLTEENMHLLIDNPHEVNLSLIDDYKD